MSASSSLKAMDRALRGLPEVKDVRIIDEDGRELPRGEAGEIVAFSSWLMPEYYKLPEKTAASFKDGWFSAGDLARRDADGYYEIVDRKDNMIITGGEHVYPSEVEEVIGSQECVFDCACISVPDEKWGEVPAAIIVPKPDQTLTAEEIKKHLAGKLAKFKIPKHFTFVAELPRNDAGKTDRRALKQLVNSSEERQDP